MVYFFVRNSVDGNVRINFTIFLYCFLQFELLFVNSWFYCYDLVQENKDLYAVFINLTKAFDTVIGKTLWVMVAKYCCPPKFVKMIELLQDGMTGQVICNNDFSETFAITNGVKQGCVFAPVLFKLYAVTSLLELSSKMLSQNINLSMKLKVYKALLFTFLCGFETWSLYSKHLKQLEHFHMRSLCSVLGMSCQDRVINLEVMEREDLPGSTHTPQSSTPLDRSCHRDRRSPHSLPTAVQRLEDGKRKQDHTRKRML